jgi:[ribosomal protein S18]-alanine N-acetyltransferase
MADRDYAIGFARIADAPALAAMSRDLVETGLGWEYRPERLARMIADANTVAVVTRDVRRPVGFAVMTFGDERAHLVLLAVRPSHQRQGIARSALAWLLESAATAGMISVHVELRATNPAAYALYCDAGFTETVRVPGYYRGREAAVRMIRVLRVPSAELPTWRPPTLDRR